MTKVHKLGQEVGRKDVASQLTYKSSLHSKNETPDLGNALPILVIFQNAGGTYFGYFSR